MIRWYSTCTSSGIRKRPFERRKQVKKYRHREKGEKKREKTGKRRRKKNSHRGTRADEVKPRHTVPDAGNALVLHGVIGRHVRELVHERAGVAAPTAGVDVGGVSAAGGPGTFTEVRTRFGVSLFLAHSLGQEQRRLQARFRDDGFFRSLVLFRSRSLRTAAAATSAAAATAVVAAAAAAAVAAVAPADDGAF